MDVNKKNIEQFNNKKASLTEIRNTPYVGLISGINDVLYASKKSFGSVIRIDDDGDKFIKPTALNRFVISSNNDTTLKINATVFRGELNGENLTEQNYHLIYHDIYTNETIECDAVMHKSDYKITNHTSDQNIGINYLFRKPEKDLTEDNSTIYAFEGYYGTFYTQQESGDNVNAYTLDNEGELVSADYVMDIAPTKITYRMFKITDIDFDIYLDEKNLFGGYIYWGPTVGINMIPAYLKDNDYYVYVGNLIIQNEIEGDIYDNPYNEIKVNKGEDIEYIVSENIDCLSSGRITQVYDDGLNAYITKINIPGIVKQIGYECFKNNVNLTSVILNEGTEKIGDEAFGYCDSLTSISIPNSVKTIGTRAFYNCYNMTSIYISSGVERIDKEAFNFYYQSYMTIPDSNNLKFIGYSSCYRKNINDGKIVLNNVEKIDAAAFIQTNLTSITIGKNIKEIAGSAFTSMNNNFDVFILSQIPPTIQGGVFDYSKLQNIYVPDESLQLYLDDNYWGNDYSDKIHPMSES